MLIVKLVTSLCTTFCVEGDGETPKVPALCDGRIAGPVPGGLLPGGVLLVVPTGGWTIRLSPLIVCETPPPLPVTWKASVPIGVPFEVVIVSVALEVFGSSTLRFFLHVAAATTLPLTWVLDFQVALAPPGRLFTPSVMFFLKPLSFFTFTVKVVEPPALTLLLFVTESLKSGLPFAA